MFIYPDMLVSAATEYPHWTVFCNAQLLQPMPYPGVHFDNACVIASIPANKICKITYDELRELGFWIDRSTVLA